MFCRCNVVEFDGKQLKKKLGRVWDLGPVVVSKEPGSNSLSIIGLRDTFGSSLVQLNEFKDAVLSDGFETPVIIRFSVSGDKGLYGMENIKFTDQASCWYRETRFSLDKIELVFEMIAKGKELCIFNGISCDAERDGVKKPLFWASLF